MFKRQIFILLSVILIFSGWSGPIIKGIAESERYYSKAGRFSINFPDGWQIKETEKPIKKEIVDVIASPLGIASAGKSRVSIGVAVEKLSSRMSSKEFFEMTLAQFKKVFNLFQEDERGEDSIDNNKACWVIYSYGGSSKLKSKVYILAKNDKGYIINYTANSDQFSEHYEKMNGVVKSFKFE